jgi:FkbM family methyltransferase
MKKIVTRLLQAFIIVGGVAVALATVIKVFPGSVVLLAAQSAPKSPYCSLWQASRDIEVKIRQANLATEIRSKSKLAKTEGEYELWSTPDGEFWVPGGSPDTLFILLAQQQRDIYGAAPASGSTVLDCGAHVGVYARKALAAGASKVVAIDPSPQALFCLRRNLAKEIAEGRVVVCPKGVWDSEGKLNFYSNGNAAAGDSFITHNKNSKVIGSIPITTIDGIVAEYGLARVDLIKADVKGAGERSIRGAAETIRRFHPRMAFSTEEAPEEPAALTKAVLALDPRYKVRCGPCLYTGDEIRTDVMFFE